MMKKILLYLLPVIFVYAYGCSSSMTSVDASWTKPGYKGKKFNKLAIVVLAKNETDRIISEEGIAKEMKLRGYNAIASSTLFPPKYFDKNGDGNLDESEKAHVKEKFSEEGIDGILISSLLDEKEETKYIPGSVYWRPTLYFSSFTYYYTSTYNYLYSPGYTVKTSRFFIGTTLYDLPTEELLWTAKTETIDPIDLKDFIKSFSKAIADEIIIQKIILR